MAGLQWVVDGYALTFAALLPSAGVVTDRIGSARAYALGVGVFTLASLACAVAPTMPVLVAARIGQGAAAALVMPSSLALVRAVFDDARERARAIATWTVGGAAAMVVGSVLGGLLSEYVSWRWVFLINVPIGAAVLALLRGRHDLGRPAARPGALDPVGQVLAVLAMAALTYALIDAGRSGWDAPGPVVAAVVTAASAAAFVSVERRSAHPVVPLPMVRQRRVLAALAGGSASISPSTVASSCSVSTTSRYVAGRAPGQA